MSGPEKLVTIFIDDREVQVPEGTNVIEAAKSIGVEIPHYCYHPNLSIAGNCRMCQIEIDGQSKLNIGCNTLAKEGLRIRTHESSEAVAAAQASTLEFILINHPLDCTVCDQSGHCKLQDYHYDYNAKASRFLEDKVEKVKAEPLGPHVILDGERCIMCSRCVRFCDEVTKTSELGLLNRGDKVVISVNKGKVLDNPLSGTVVDLCPVGALTHRDWRFNTRIWYTSQVDAVCPGCSTGCNVKVATRDNQVVHVKARLNEEVNKEWLCDEGRYGFNRFLPEQRLLRPLLSGKDSEWESAFGRIREIESGTNILCLIAGDVLLEDLWALRSYCNSKLSGKNLKFVAAYRERDLTEVEKVLISPDYCANFRGAQFLSLGESGDGIQNEYEHALADIKAHKYDTLLLVGDRSVLKSDQSEELLNAILKLDRTFGFFAESNSSLVGAVNVAFPIASILERSGLLVNRRNRLQYSDALLKTPRGVAALGRLFDKAAGVSGSEDLSPTSDRAATLRLLDNDERLKGLTIKDIKAGGVCLNSYKPKQSGETSSSNLENRV